MAGAARHIGSIVRKWLLEVGCWSPLVIGVGVEAIRPGGAVQVVGFTNGDLVP